MIETLDLVASVMIAGGACLIVATLLTSSARCLFCGLYLIAAGTVYLASNIPFRGFILLALVIVGAAVTHWEYDQETARKERKDD